MNTICPEQRWCHIGVSYGSETFLIDGVNTFATRWDALEGHPEASVIDPLHGRLCHFPIYSIATRHGRAVFAAGEFSSGVWGFYVPSDDGQTPGAPRMANDAVAAASGRVIVLGVPAWRAVLPYVPLLLAVFNVPWVIFVVMLHLGGPVSPFQEPGARELFVAEIVLPSVLGLACGAATLGVARPRGRLAWLVLLLGSFACTVLAWVLSFTS